MSDLIVREHGSGSRFVVAIHGGPGVAGDAGPLARALGQKWHVLEPFQRGSGGRPLTVATHVRDLDDVVRERCDGRRPVLVGHSWGAMLALAYAADHPGTAAALVLIGSGTFSTEARAEFQRRLDARLTGPDRTLLASLSESDSDPNRNFADRAALIRRLYGYDAEDAADETVLDSVAHDETWADMMRLQRQGIYPARFAAIHVPVLMIHGDRDPHPAALIKKDLERYLPQLDYRVLPACGHYPWLERKARERFFDVLTTWLNGAFGKEP